MIEFTNIVIDGFRSIGHLELPLNTRGITVIRGANGFGKSTIFSALVWALYGKAINGVSSVNTWKRFRPRGYKGTKVEVYFNKDGHIHQVIRCSGYTEEISKGLVGGDKLIYQIDGDSASIKGKRNIQDSINTSLNMSHSLFVNSIMFGQGLKKLIQETGSNQKEIFEEVFDLGYLTKAKKIAQDKFYKADSEVHNINLELNGALDSVKSLNESTKELEDQDKNYGLLVSRELEDIEEKRSKLEKDLQRLESEKFDSKALNDKVKKLQNKISAERDKLNNAKQATGISIETLIEKIIELLKNKKYDASLKELTTLHEAFITQEKSKTRISTLQDKSSEVSSKLYKAREQELKIKSTKTKISELDIQLKKVGKNKPDFNKLILKNKERIRGYKDKANELKDKLSTYTDSRDLYKWAYSEPFGNTGIKAYLFESCLQQLNDTLDTYSEVLGFSIQFYVDLDSARKDFKTRINLDGQEASYEELSEGQKQLVNLAMAFSMNTMVAQAQGVNIAFLDEVFESLSEDNIEIVVGLIKKVYQDKTLFLITHQESLPIPNARILRVKRVNGISEYTL